MILTEETIHVRVRRYLNNYVDGVYVDGLTIRYTVSMEYR